MIPTEPIALAILLAIVPGYLTIFFWSRNRTWKGLRGDLQTILQSLSLSLAIQALLAPVTLRWLFPVRDHLANHPLRVTSWLILAALIIPFVMGTVAARIGNVRRPEWLLRLRLWLLLPAAPPTLWDWAAKENGIMDGKWIVIEFTDGRRIGGPYGRPDGIAMTSPDDHGIYIPQEWLLDARGDFWKPVANTRGIIVPIGSDIRSIRLLEGGKARQ